MSRLQVLGVAALLALAARPRQALAVGDQFGRIKGVVTDANSGQPQASATVVARSPALIGGPRTTTSDHAGRYQLTELPAGSYTIEVSYPGVIPTERKVAVRPGEAVALNIAWSVQAEGVEGVSVTEARQRTRPDSATTGTVLETESLSRLPTNRSYQGAAQLVPGVRGGDNPNIKGGGSGQNHYLVDGLDVTDPVTGTFAINLGFDSIQSIEVITGGMDAEYNSIGGIINVVSRGGSDEHNATASLYLNHQKLSSTGNFGTNPWETQEPFNDLEPGPDRSGQINLNFGGPILKQKLWYGASYELRVRESSTVRSAPLGASPYNVQHPAASSQSHQARLKLTYVPTPAHRLSLSGMISPGIFNNTLGGNSLLGAAERHQNQNSILTVLAWDWSLLPNLTPNVQIGYLMQSLEVGPQGLLGDVDFTGCELFGPENCVWRANRARHLNLADGTAWYQSTDYVLDRRSKLTFEPSITWRTSFFGSHDVKAGFQGQWNRRHGESRTLGGVVYRDRGATGPFDMGLCDPDPMSPKSANCYRTVGNPPVDGQQTGYGAGFFIRDRWWTPLTWLTLTPGLRFDYGTTRDTRGRTITTLWGLSPRVGAAADITGDGRNVVSAYYGRHTDTLSLNQPATVDDNEVVTTTKQWNAKSGMFENYMTSGGPGGLRISPNLKAPHSDEVTLAARRELVPGTVAGVEYTWKRIANNWASIEVNRIWDPTGERVVGWADPAKKDQNVTELTTRDGVDQIYHGIDLYTNGKPAPNWEYSASYTLSWNYRRSLPNAFTSNPRQLRFDNGYIAQDLRHYMRLAGAYTFFDRLTVGGYMIYVTGTPQTKLFFEPADGARDFARTPAGTTPNAPNDPKAIAEFRAPDTVRLDLHFEYNVLPLQMRSRLKLIVDVFNVLNPRTPSGVTATDLPTFGQITGRQNPRRMQLAVNYLY